MVYRDKDGKLVKRDGGPQEAKESLVDELVNNVCEILMAPHGSLIHLDIADMGFNRKNLRKIVTALKKNTTLRSINFGALNDTDERKRISYWTSKADDYDRVEETAAHMI